MNNKYFAVLITISVCASNAYAQDSTNPINKYKDMVKLMGGHTIAYKAMKKKIQKSKHENPQYSHFYECMDRKITENTFIEMTAPIFRKKYTEEEADAVITFFTSSTGKKVSYSMATGSKLHLTDSNEKKKFNDFGAKYMNKNRLKLIYGDIQKEAFKYQNELVRKCS